MVCAEHWGGGVRCAGKDNFTIILLNSAEDVSASDDQVSSKMTGRSVLFRGVASWFWLP